MKKKGLLFLLALCLWAALAVPAAATAHDGLCSCGREYATEQTGEYMEYDCLGCGRNFTSCVCDTCWCGEKLIRSGEGGEATATCQGCKLPCEECICRDRSYYAALRGVKNGVTDREIPFPSNGVLVTLAAAAPFAVFLWLYFTVYRRRTASENRKSRTARLEKELDRIDREPDGKLRYAMAKAREEASREDGAWLSDREAQILCLHRNELLAGALDEDWIRETAEENIRTGNAMNDIGYHGSVEHIDRLWNFEKKDFIQDREELSGETTAQNLVKWDTLQPEIALHEIVTPLNGLDNNRLPPAGNLTRFAARLSAPEFGDGSPTDPETEEERRKTFEAILPGCDGNRFLPLCETGGAKLNRTVDLPEVSPRKMGDKNRFPGGIAK